MDLNMRLDMLNINNFMLGGTGSNSGDPQAAPPGSGGGGAGDARGPHQRVPSSTAASYMNGGGDGGGGGVVSSSLFQSPPRSTPDASDFDFCVASGPGGGWPTSPIFTTSTSTVAFGDHPHSHHHQQHHHQPPPRLRSESTSALLNPFLSPPPPLPTTSVSSALQQNRFVDLDAASSSMSPPEFLSKLRSQLAMASNQQQQQQQQQPAPISPPTADQASLDRDLEQTEPAEDQHPSPKSAAGGDNDSSNTSNTEVGD